MRRLHRIDMAAIRMPDPLGHLPLGKSANSGKDDLPHSIRVAIFQRAAFSNRDRECSRFPPKMHVWPLLSRSNRYFPAFSATGFEAGSIACVFPIASTLHVEPTSFSFTILYFFCDSGIFPEAS